MAEQWKVRNFNACESLYTDGKWSTQRLYDFGFSRRFVLVRVWYLSSSEAYTNNWGLFGKENYSTFDWWKHFLKILRRSEVTINLTWRLKKNGSKWVRPLVVLYSIFFFFFFFFRTHLAPVGNTTGATSGAGTSFFFNS